MAAGSRQQSRFIALMSDYDRTMQLVGAANSSAGASQRQYEKTLESVESKLAKLNNAWTAFTTGLMNSTLIKFGIDLLTGLLNVINSLTTGFGTLDGTIGGFISSILKLGTVVLAFVGGNKLFFKLAAYYKGAIAKAMKDGTKEGAEAGAKEMNKEVDKATKKTASTSQSKSTTASQSKSTTTSKDKATSISQNKAETKSEKDLAKAKNEATAATKAQAAAEKKETVEGAKNTAQNKQESTTEKENAAAKTGNAAATTAEAAAEIVDGEAKDKNTQDTVENTVAQEINNNEKKEGVVVSGAKIGATVAENEAIDENTESTIKNKVAEDSLNKKEAIGIVTKLKSVGALLFGGKAKRMAAAQTLGLAAAEGTATTATTILNAAMMALPIGWILAGLAAIVAVAAMLDASIETDAERMERLSKTSEELGTELEEANGRLSEITDQKQALTDLHKEMDGLTAGTNAWRQKLLEANQIVIDLMDKFPSLVEYVERGKNGELLISEEGWQKATTEQMKAISELQTAKFATEASIAETQQRINIGDANANPWYSETAFNVIDGEMLKIEMTRFVDGLENSIYDLDSQEVQGELQDFADRLDMTTDEVKKFINELSTLELSGAINREQAIRGALEDAGSLSQQQKDNAARLISENAYEKIIEDQVQKLDNSSDEQLIAKYAEVTKQDYTELKEKVDDDVLSIDTIKSAIATVNAKGAIQQQAARLNNLKVSYLKPATVDQLINSSFNQVPTISSNVTTAPPKLNSGTATVSSELLNAVLNNTVTANQLEELKADEDTILNAIVTALNAEGFDGQEIRQRITQLDEKNEEIKALLYGTAKDYVQDKDLDISSQHALATTLKDVTTNTGVELETLTEKINAFAEEAGITESEMTNFKKALSQIDLTNINSIEELSVKLKSFGVTIPIDKMVDLEDKLKVLTKASQDAADALSTVQRHDRLASYNDIEAMILEKGGNATFTAEEKDSIVNVELAAEDEFIQIGDEYILMGKTTNDLLGEIAKNTRTTPEATMNSEDARAAKEFLESGDNLTYNDDGTLKTNQNSETSELNFLEKAGNFVSTNIFGTGKIFHGTPTQGSGPVSTQDAYDTRITNLENHLKKAGYTQTQLDALKQTEDGAQKTAQQIEQALTDALNNAVQSSDVNDPNYWSSLGANTIASELGRGIAEGTIEVNDDQFVVMTEALKAQAKQLGINVGEINDLNKAQEVAAQVMRLKFNKELGKNKQRLTDLNETLSTTSKNSDTYRDTITEISNILSSVFDIEIDETFFDDPENVNLYRDAISGVEGAWDSLYQKMFREELKNEVKLKLNIPQQQVDSVMSMLDGLEFDVNGKADFTQIFNALLAAGKSATEIANIIKSIGGMEMDFSYVDKAGKIVNPNKLYKVQGANKSGLTAGSAGALRMREDSEFTQSVPVKDMTMDQLASAGLKITSNISTPTNITPYTSPGEDSGKSGSSKSSSSKAGDKLPWYYRRQVKQEKREKKQDKFEYVNSTTNSLNQLINSSDKLIKNLTVQINEAASNIKAAEKRLKNKQKKANLPKALKKYSNLLDGIVNNDGTINDKKYNKMMSKKLNEKEQAAWEKWWSDMEDTMGYLSDQKQRKVDLTRTKKDLETPIDYVWGEEYERIQQKLNRENSAYQSVIDLETSKPAQKRDLSKINKATQNVIANLNATASNARTYKNNANKQLNTEYSKGAADWKKLLNKDGTINAAAYEKYAFKTPELKEKFDAWQEEIKRLNDIKTEQEEIYNNSQKEIAALKEQVSQYTKITELERSISDLQRSRSTLTTKQSTEINSGKTDVGLVAEMMVAQKELLNAERIQQTALRATKQDELNTYFKNNPELSRYVSKSGDVHYDNINADVAAGLINRDAVDEMVGEVVNLNTNLKEIDTEIANIENEVSQLTLQVAQDSANLQDKVVQAITKERQREIKQLQDINKTIKDTNSKLIAAVQKNIKDIRQSRNNERTEDEIADKEARLAYLKQNTGVGNLTEIKALEEEIEKAKESYTDSLVDQRLTEIQNQNTKAAEQRERQINILQSQLDYDTTSGVILAEALAAINAGIDENGGIKEDSYLYTLLVNPIENLSKSEEKIAIELNEIEKLIGSFLAQQNWDNPNYWANETPTKLRLSDGTTAEVGKEFGNKGTVQSFSKPDKNGNVAITSKSNDGTTTTTTVKVAKQVGDDGYQNAYEVDSESTTSTAAPAKQTKTATTKSTSSTTSKKAAYAKGDFVRVKDKRWDQIKADKYAYGWKGHKGVYKIVDVKNGQFTLSPSAKATKDRQFTVKQSDISKKVSEPKDLKLIKNKKMGYRVDGDTSYRYHYLGKTKDKKNKMLSFNGKQEKKVTTKKLKQYKTGGIADFTGPAWLDGTKAKPEIILNARDTENFIQLKDALSSFLGARGGNTTTQQTGDFNCDVHINVEKLTSDYDVDKVAKRVKKIINDEGRYRNVNQITRLR